LAAAPSRSLHKKSLPPQAAEGGRRLERGTKKPVITSLGTDNVLSAVGEGWEEAANSPRSSNPLPLGEPGIYAV